MFQSWRLKLREAEQAVEQGRLEEATRLIRVADLDQYLPGQRLTAKIAERMADRARKHFVSGNSSAGWRDLESARDLGGESDKLIEVRRDLLGRILGDAERYLASDNPGAALALIEKLEQRQLDGALVRATKEAARRLESARRLSAHGHFVEAEEHLAAAHALRPDLQALEQRRQACQEKRDQARVLTEQLHRAVAERRWSEAVSLADRILELAPECQLARDARRRAWAEVNDDERRPLAETQQWTPSRGGRATAVLEEAPAIADGPGNQQFLLWVDAVGGFLVNLKEEIVVGQATPNNRVDVAIQADLSRKHFVIKRHGEGYVLEPLQATRVNGARLEGATILADRDVIEASGGVRLTFRQPHALSSSARLEFTSRHRSQPYVDAVLLMAESCVLGPHPQNHIECRDWSNDVVLYRQDDCLYCRAMDSFEVDGRLCDGRGQVNLNSHIVGEDFSLCLEEL